MLSGKSPQHALSCSLFARQQQAQEERRANGSNGIKGSKGKAKGSKRKEALPRANKNKSQALPDPPPVSDHYREYSK